MNRIWVLLAVLFLGACASTDEIDIEPKELQDFAPKVKLQKLWSVSAGAGQDARYTRFVPVISGDQIFALDKDGDVFAFDKAKGKKRWSVELDQEISAGLGQSAKALLLGSYKGEVIALSKEDGSELWRTTLSSEVVSEPAASAGVVVATTNDGRLYGLNGETGEIKWFFESVQPVLTLRGTSAPVVRGETVIAGFDNGKVYAFEIETGLIQWEQRVAVPKGKTELERIVDIDGTPLLAGDVLYAVSYQGRLMAFASATGRPMWGEEASSVQGPAADYSQVYIAGEQDKVQAFSTATGVKVWENADLLRRKLSPPAVLGSYVAVADLEGYLHLLDRETGEMAARDDVDGDGVRARMLVENDVLYILGTGGELSAWRTKSL